MEVCLHRVHVHAAPGPIHAPQSIPTHAESSHAAGSRRNGFVAAANIEFHVAGSRKRVKAYGEIGEGVAAVNQSIPRQKFGATGHALTHKISKTGGGKK